MNSSDHYIRHRNIRALLLPFFFVLFYFFFFQQNDEQYLKNHKPPIKHVFPRIPQKDGWRHRQVSSKQLSSKSVGRVWSWDWADCFSHVPLLLCFLSVYQTRCSVFQRQVYNTGGYQHTRRLTCAIYSLIDLSRVDVKQLQKQGWQKSLPPKLFLLRNTEQSQRLPVTIPFPFIEAGIPAWLLWAPQGCTPGNTSFSGCHLRTLIGKNVFNNLVRELNSVEN